MTDRLENLLRACTVRLIGRRGSGTGFFVAPGMVITCAHVAEDIGGLTVRWERDGQPAAEAVVSAGTVLAGRGRPMPRLDHDYPDVALLKVTGLPAHPCVGIDGAGWPADGDVFWAFGYPTEGGAVQLTPARLAYRGTKGVRPTAYIDLASDTVKPGMSGSALLNLRTGAVVGIIVASKNPSQPDGALAVPLSAISTELREALMANRDFHRRNPGWTMTLDDGQVEAGGWQYPGPLLRGYLAAAVRSATDHPYPGIRAAQPPLATVYVRQQARPVSDASPAASPAHGTADLLTWVPSDAVFSRSESCFVVGGPGGGKSSLLRTALIQAAAACTQGKEDAPVPVRVLAADLATRVELADAIAAGVRADLGSTGWDASRPGVFAAEPLRGRQWLVLVDGLDEVAAPSARQEIINKLTEAVRNRDQCPYRFVVTTREIPDEPLPHGGGWAEYPYELQPFGPQQVRDLAERWFSAFQVPDPGSATDRFVAELDRVKLAELARVPLMATMLSHLFALNDGHSLPESRAEAYRDFVDLLRRHAYAETPGGLNAQIHALLDRYGPVATSAGGALIASLPQLIDRLAAARINGDSSPSLDLICSWTSAQRPPNVSPAEWRSILGELLRHSGLFVERRSDFVFLHQTITEYLGARHVAADPQLTARAWRQLFGLHGFATSWIFPGEDWSYRRFLAAAWSGRPELTSALLQISRMGINTCMFIAYLAGDRMKLPAAVVSAATTRLEKTAIGKRPRRSDDPTRRPGRWAVAGREVSTVNRAHAIVGLSLLGEDRRSSALFAEFIADPLLSVKGLWQIVTGIINMPLTESQTKQILAVIATKAEPVVRSRFAQYEKQWALDRRLGAARRLEQLGDVHGIIEPLAAQLAASDQEHQLAAAMVLAVLLPKTSSVQVRRHARIRGGSRPGVGVFVCSGGRSGPGR